MVEIHPSAIVHPEAVIGEGTQIGAFSIVEAHTRIGKNCILRNNAIVRSYVTMGDHCEVDSFAVIGGNPQHLKYAGEPTRVEIGDHVIMRECVTVHRGTVAGGGVTRIANRTYIMAYSHVAHDCYVGNDVILANAVQMAGHTSVDDFSVVGGHSAIVQFCRVGSHCYLGGGTVVRKDMPPFLSGKGTELEIQGVNAVGLARRGFSKERIRAIKDVYRLIYLKNLTVTEAIAAAVAEGTNDDTAKFLEFIKGSKIGIVR